MMEMIVGSPVLSPLLSGSRESPASARLGRRPQCGLGRVVGVTLPETSADSAAWLYPQDCPPCRQIYYRKSDG